MTRTYVHLLGLVAFISGRFEDRKDRGATAVEYGLLVGLIAVVLIIAVGTLGTNISGLFGRLSGDVNGIAP
jgi:pilus assembly protein Flp/PilA